MSEETNAKLSSIANAFPGNTESVPDFVAEDELFATAFEIYPTSSRDCRWRSSSCGSSTSSSR
jgi:hypothetical protein